MAFTLTQFEEYYPRLYHLTATINIPRIIHDNCLKSAQSLITKSGIGTSLRAKRSNSLQIIVDGHEISIRDQSPLHEGNCDLHGGFTFGDFVEYLNQRIYLWPGKLDQPNDYGQRYFKRYGSENPSVMCIDTEALLACNADNPPWFSKYNSGSPRCSYGKKSPRGPSTFVSCSDAEYPLGGVVEVSFYEMAELPIDGFEVLPLESFFTTP